MSNLGGARGSGGSGTCGPGRVYDVLTQLGESLAGRHGDLSCLEGSRGNGDQLGRLTLACGDSDGSALHGVGLDRGPRDDAVEELRVGRAGPGLDEAGRESSASKDLLGSPGLATVHDLDLLQDLHLLLLLHRLAGGGHHHGRGGGRGRPRLDRLLVEVLERRGHAGREGDLGRVERLHELLLRLGQPQLGLGDGLGGEGEGDGGNLGGRGCRGLLGWRRGGLGLDRHLDRFGRGRPGRRRRGRGDHGLLATAGAPGGTLARLPVVVSRLVLLQLSLVSVAAVTDPAHVGLLPGVDPAVGDVSLPPEESFAAGPALVRKVSGVSPGMSVQLAPITKTFLTHRAVERSLAWTEEINHWDHPGGPGGYLSASGDGSCISRVS